MKQVSIQLYITMNDDVDVDKLVEVMVDRAVDYDASVCLIDDQTEDVTT